MPEGQLIITETVAVINNAEAPLVSEISVSLGFEQHTRPELQAFSWEVLAGFPVKAMAKLIAGPSALDLFS